MQKEDKGKSEPKKPEEKSKDEPKPKEPTKLEDTFQDEPYSIRNLCLFKRSLLIILLVSSKGQLFAQFYGDQEAEFSTYNYKEPGTRADVSK